MKDLNFYTREFAERNVNRNGVSAPNKPILLLSIIELIEPKKFQHN